MGVKLNTISLKNFKKHANLKVEFSDSLTVIRGPNYSGKSTIFQALFFALFGSTAVPGGRKLVVKRGESDCKVKLSMEIDGENIYIERTPTTASVSNDDEMLATGTSVVSSWVEERLGFNQKTIMQLMYSQQSETASILTLGAASLNRIIEEVSGADYIEKLINRSNEKAKSAKNIIDGIGSVEDTAAMAALIAEKSTELAKEVKVEEKLKSSVETMDKKYQELKVQLKDAEANNKLFNDQEVIKATTNSRISSLVELNNEVKASLKELGTRPNVTELASEREAFTANISSIEIYNKKLERSQDYTARKKSEIADTTSKFEISVPALEALEDKEKEKEIVSKKYSEQVAEYKALKVKIEELEETISSGICAACDRPFDNSDEHLEKAEKDKAQLQKKVLEYVATVKEIKDSFDAVCLEISSLKQKAAPMDWKEILACLKEELTEEEKVLKDLKSSAPKGDLTALKLNLEKVTEKITLATRKCNEIETLTEKGLRYIGEIDDLSDIIEALKPVELIEVTEINKSKDEIEEKLSNKKEQLSAMSFENTNLAKEIDDLVFKKNDADNKNEKIRLHETRAANFSALTKWLRISKENFLNSLWANILAYVSEFSSLATDNDIEEVIRDDDGGFSFIEEGETCPLAGASGGQKSIMGVGMRLALATLLPQGLDLVLLDEPSSELSDEKAAAMAGALRAQNKQVALVTHRAGEEYSSESLIILD